MTEPLRRHSEFRGTLDPARAVERARLHAALAASVETRQEGPVLARHLARRLGRPAIVLARGGSTWRLIGHEDISRERIADLPAGLDLDGWLDALSGSSGWVARDMIHGRRVVGRVALLAEARFSDEAALAAEVASPFVAAREPRLPSLEDGPPLQLSQVVHDLRQPLASFVLSLQLIEEGGDLGAHIARCRRGVQRMNGMIGDLLTLGGPSRKRPVEVPLGPLLLGVAEDHRERAGRAGVTVEVQITTAATVMGFVDPLHRALDNLLSNALDASPPGGVVTLHLGADRDAARICVLDQGPGVPEPLRERVFEPFFTTRSSGHGLGLAVARDAAQRHGGTIRFVDGPGGLVELLLPLTRRSASRNSDDPPTVALNLPTRSASEPNPATSGAAPLRSDRRDRSSRAPG